MRILCLMLFTVLGFYKQPWPFWLYEWLMMLASSKLNLSLFSSTPAPTLEKTCTLRVILFLFCSLIILDIWTRHPWGCVGVGRLWDINRSWFQRPLLTRLYVRASIQLSLSHCSLVTGWSARPCDLSILRILRQAVHMWWHLKSGFLEGKYKMGNHVED